VNWGQSPFPGIGDRFPANWGQSPISWANKKKGIAVMTMPRCFAGDPAPQQLTAPCRKYSGRLRAPIEQVVYRQIS
jgi:hypothetical protein